jgi:hypothetical protein
LTTIEAPVFVDFHQQFKRFIEKLQFFARNSCDFHVVDWIGNFAEKVDAIFCNWPFEVICQTIELQILCHLQIQQLIEFLSYFGEFVINWPVCSCSAFRFA